MAELTITAASVLSSTPSYWRDVTAGATVTRGQPVYKDTADSDEYKPAINTASASAAAEGIALNDADDGQPLKITTAGDTITIGATVDPEAGSYVVASTAGKIELVTDLASTEYITYIGEATSTTQIKLTFNATGVQHA